MPDTLYGSPTFEPGDDVNPEDPVYPSITMCLPNTVFLSQGSARGTGPNCGDGDGNGPPAIPSSLDIDDGWYIDSISVSNTLPLETRPRGRRR